MEEEETVFKLAVSPSVQRINSSRSSSLVPESPPVFHRTNSRSSTGSTTAPPVTWYRRVIEAHNSRAWFLIIAGLLVLINQAIDINILFNFALEGDWGWFYVSFLFIMLAWVIAGLFTSIESWLDPYAKTSFMKFVIGFCQFHIILSTYIAYRKELEVQAMKNLTKRSRSSDTSATNTNLVLGAKGIVMDVFYGGSSASSSAPRFIPAGSQSARKLSACMDPEALRSMRINQVWEFRKAAHTAKAVQQAADWLRLVECIFENIPGIMLQCYIAVLTRRARPVGIFAILIGILSLSVNVAIIVGEDQPLPRKVALFAHVFAQMAMRTVFIAWISVAQAERAIPWIIGYACISLFFSLALYNSMGSVISNLFAVPLFFLAWDTTRMRKSDIFGWKRFGTLDSRATLLRVFISWRFLENIIGVIVVVMLVPINPCTRAGEDLRYEDEYCVACCRGPIYYSEVIIVTVLSSIVYISSWIAGWYLDNVTYAQEKLHGI